MGAIGWLRPHYAPGGSGGNARPAREERPAILIVDDELVVRNLLQGFLVLEGYQVMCAGDGIEAVELFRRHPGAIQAVILDVLMARMDGCDTYEAMREIDPTMPMIMMSGFDPGERTAKLIGRPDTRFIGKPFALGDVLMRIEEVLGLGARPRSTSMTEPISWTPAPDRVTD